MSRDMAIYQYVLTGPLILEGLGPPGSNTPNTELYKYLLYLCCHQYLRHDADSWGSGEGWLSQNWTLLYVTTLHG